MKFFKRRGRLAAAGIAALALTGSLLTASPAFAGPYDCPSGHSCDWHGANFDGTLWSTNGSVAVYSTSNRQKTSSMANRSTRGAKWFNDYNYGGGITWFLSGGDSAQLANCICNDSWRSKAH